MPTFSGCARGAISVRSNGGATQTCDTPIQPYFDPRRDAWISDICGEKR
jgi:hypothetical protein